MIIKDELLFYNPSKFNILKKYYQDLGKEIFSISEFILDENQVNIKHSFDTVIDISSFASIIDSSFQIERLINLFSNNYIFISDIKHKSKFENELRFCFENFIDFEDFLEEDAEENSEVRTLIKKEHRKITDLNNDELNNFFEIFNESLYGHNKFKDDFRNQIDNFRVFNKLGEHKVLSLFLMGDSGVGKTEVARAILRALNGKKMAKVNFGNYSSDNSLNSLIGSPRGYIGSEDGELFMRVNESDSGVILIDEFEKSNSTLFNYFLDVLENGKMISSLAHEIDLNGFIIVFTSNISKEDFKNIISPELRSRFDYKCYFSILKNEDKFKFVEFRVNNIIKKFNKLVANVLDDEFKYDLIYDINVMKYKNMRDLNKEIKKLFVKKIMNRIIK